MTQTPPTSQPRAARILFLTLSGLLLPLRCAATKFTSGPTTEAESAVLTLLFIVFPAVVIGLAILNYRLRSRALMIVLIILYLPLFLLGLCLLFIPPVGMVITVFNVSIGALILHGGQRRKPPPDSI